MTNTKGSVFYIFSRAFDAALEQQLLFQLDPEVRELVVHLTEVGLAEIYTTPAGSKRLRLTQAGHNHLNAANKAWLDVAASGI